jgi:hypothetical protein
MAAGADEFSVVCQSLRQMRLLLTSGGIRNASIHAALVRLLGKPIAEANTHTVVDGAVEVVTEGRWKLFTPSREAS